MMTCCYSLNSADAFVPPGECRLTGVTFCLLLQMIKHADVTVFHQLGMLKVDTNRTGNLYLSSQGLSGAIGDKSAVSPSVSGDPQIHRETPRRVSTHRLGTADMFRCQQGVYSLRLMNRMKRVNVQCSK